MFPAHGDVRLPILAPGTVEECFIVGGLALNWAERYQGPVIVMSEFGLAERSENIKKPNLSNVIDERRNSKAGDNGFKRYQSLGKNGELSAMPIPGNQAAYVANGSEHDEIGDTTHEVLAHVSGKMRMHFIKILPGDVVKLDISPYDLTRGRITYRNK